MSAEPIVTPALVRRYLQATGRHDAGLFDAYHASFGMPRALRYMGIDRAVFGMLAAAEMALDAGTTWERDRVLRRKMIEAAGVDPEAWDAARRETP